MTETRLFGTNGIRGVVNKDLTPEFALKVGTAIGTFMKGTVAVASDTRASGDMIRSAVFAGLMYTGCNILDLGVVPTPVLQYFVKTHPETAGGVMITASHNPPQFNGIKCISSDGTEMARSDEEKIEGIFFKGHPETSDAKPGTVEKIRGAAETYIDAIISKVDASAIRHAGLKAVLDCANGAAFFTTPLLLKKLNVKATTLNADPQGEFPGHPSEPTEENLKDLIGLMGTSDADLGIAHDGDADRTVFVAGGGGYVSGDKTLALIARSELKKRKGVIVTPVASSSLVEEVVKDAGGKVLYTAVGSPVVARAMISAGAVFGGEENGGLIFPEMQYCRDGAMAVAKMLESIVKHGPLAQQILTLPVYHTHKLKIDCPECKKKALLKALSGKCGAGRKDETDGLKIIFEDGWVLIRPSGTEPIFRVYSESKDNAVAKKRGEEFIASAKECLKII